MKYIATIALTLSLGVATAFGQMDVKMTFSGTAAASSADLKQPNSINSEENVSGTGTFGQFTLRDIRAGGTVPQPSTACSGLYLPTTAGAAVIRFQGGALLKLNLTSGGDCIDLVAGVAHCTLNFTIVGGTGRFKSATGTLTYTETSLPMLADATSNPIFFTETGEITGTISGVSTGVPLDEAAQEDEL